MEQLLSRAKNEPFSFQNFAKNCSFTENLKQKYKGDQSAMRDVWSLLEQERTQALQKVEQLRADFLKLQTEQEIERENF